MKRSRSDIVISRHKVLLEQGSDGTPVQKGRNSSDKSVHQVLITLSTCRFESRTRRSLARDEVGEERDDAWNEKENVDSPEEEGSVAVKLGQRSQNDTRGNGSTANKDDTRGSRAARETTRMSVAAIQVVDHDHWPANSNAEILIQEDVEGNELHREAVKLDSLEENEGHARHHPELQEPVMNRFQQEKVNKDNMDDLENSIDRFNREPRERVGLIGFQLRFKILRQGRHASPNFVHHQRGSGKKCQDNDDTPHNRHSLDRTRDLFRHLARGLFQSVLQTFNKGRFAKTQSKDICQYIFVAMKRHRK